VDKKLFALSVGLLLIAAPVTVLADDLDDALQALKDAQPSKDVAKIKQLAAAAHQTAKKWETATAPTDADKESVEARARYAQEVDTYSEYALYALAVQTDSKTAADLTTTLEQQNPKSKYLEMPDLLGVLADNALSRKQTDRALSYANRIVASAGKKAPEGITEAEWERTRTAALGRGYWIAGVIYGDQGKYKDADKDLRAALPLIKGNNAMLGPALFYLGVANYNLSNMTANKARMVEAAKFSQESAAIAGPYQDQAYKNSLAMKTAADKMR
jgi:tetratricopeptide (TPR) repeat protein